MSVGRMRARAAFIAAGVLVAMAFGAVSASAETVEFKPAAEQPFTVPAGVSQLEVLAVGGAGEEGQSCVGAPESAGSGAKVNAMLPVSEGETLKVRFGGGGAGGTGSCANGGAGGGRSELLGSSPLVVAAGGGGAGGNYGDGANLGGYGGNANALVGESGHVGFFFGGYEPRFAGGGGEGAGASPGKGGAAGEATECVSGFAGMLQTGGEGGGPGGEQQCEGGGGGGGGHTGGGGGGSGFEGGGGGGAGSSFIDPSATTGEVASGANEAQRVLITYTVPPCSMASGHGTVNRQGEPGHLGVIDSLSTNLAEPQKLSVNYEHNNPRYHLVKLQEASCTGEPGERVFSGKGTAIRKSKMGYTVSFSIKEKAGGFFFESKVMKGAEEIEANGGPLKTTTQKIS